jgi:hypothetical protein
MIPFWNFGGSHSTVALSSPIVLTLRLITFSGAKNNFSLLNFSSSKTIFSAYSMRRKLTF